MANHDPQPDPDSRPKARRPVALVPAGGCFEGTIAFSEHALLEGTVRGPIHCSGHLEVAASGRVEGDVVVDRLTLEGEIEGDVEARDGATLAAGATLRGTLRTAALHMADGARLEGRCRAGDAESGPIDSRD